MLFESTLQSQELKKEDIIILLNSFRSLKSLSWKLNQLEKSFSSFLKTQLNKNFMKFIKYLLILWRIIERFRCLKKRTMKEFCIGPCSIGFYFSFLYFSFTLNFQLSLIKFTLTFGLIMLLFTYSSSSM